LPNLSDERNRKEVNVMKIATSFLAALLLTGSLGAGSSFAAAEGVISNTVLVPGSSCHLTFPAIQEDTLSSDRRSLRIRAKATSSTSMGRAIQTRLGKIKSTSRGCNASIAGSGITMTENHWNGARGRG